MRETKIAIVLREDLQTWQKLNVTAFLTSGIIGRNRALIGEPYEDADNNQYSALLVQPVIVLTADQHSIQRTYSRAMSRDVKLSIYTHAMFSTGNDAANRAVVKERKSEQLDLVGLGIRDERKVIDKITKGLQLHK